MTVHGKIYEALQELWERFDATHTRDYILERFCAFLKSRYHKEEILAELEKEQ